MLLPARRASFQSERLEFRPLASQEGRLAFEGEGGPARENEGQGDSSFLPRLGVLVAYGEAF